MKNTIILITLLSTLYGANTLNKMLMFTSFVLLLGVLTYLALEIIISKINNYKEKKIDQERERSIKDKVEEKYTMIYLDKTMKYEIKVHNPQLELELQNKKNEGFDPNKIDPKDIAIETLDRKNWKIKNIPTYRSPSVNQITPKSFENLSIKGIKPEFDTVNIALDGLTFTSQVEETLFNLKEWRENIKNGDKYLFLDSMGNEKFSDWWKNKHDIYRRLTSNMFPDTEQGKELLQAYKLKLIEDNK